MRRPYCLRHPIWWARDGIWLDDLLRRRRLRAATRRIVVDYLEQRDLTINIIELRTLAFRSDEEIRLAGHKSGQEHRAAVPERPQGNAKPTKHTRGAAWSGLHQAVTRAVQDVQHAGAPAYGPGCRKCEAAAAAAIGVCLAEAQRAVERVQADCDWRGRDALDMAFVALKRLGEEQA